MKRLVRRPDQGSIAGVCAGLAEYFETDVTLVRLAWVLLSIFPGALIGGVLAYAAAWLLMPEAPGIPATASTGRHLRRSATNRKIAGICGGIAEYFSVDATAVRLAVVVLTIYPGAIICGLVAYGVAWLVIPLAEGPTFAPSPTTA
jgi:phage shock protein PspC (stress-responsive transcriptional regulator)